MREWRDEFERDQKIDSATMVTVADIINNRGRGARSSDDGRQMSG